MNYTGDKPLTVLMLVQSLPPLPVGGAEIQALRLGRELASLGIRVLFITPGVGRVKGKDTCDGMPVFRLHSPLNYLLDLLFVVKKKTARPVSKIEYDDTKETTDAITTPVNLGARLRYIVFFINAWFFLRKRKREIDIIHTHTIEWPAYVGALLSRLFGKKLVVKDSTMNGIFSILRYPAGERKRALIIQQAHFVAMTKVIKENFLKAGVPADRIHAIPNGIAPDGKMWQPLAGAARKVLFVGNLYQQPAKGVDILLKAWVTVQHTVPGASLYVAGDGELEAYKKYVSDLGIAGSVHFLGKQSDVTGLLLQCSLFVLPSRREGMPNALMEAMMRGVPCIATNISGCQDLIADQVNGLLVPVADVGRLAAAIVYMLEHPEAAAAMGAKARETVCRDFTIQLVAEKYAALYKSLVPSVNQTLVL